MITRSVFVGLVLATCTAATSAGPVIGQLSDPCQPGIAAYGDIVSARVERNGETLTFVMELRGPAPLPGELPDDEDIMTYLWLVDADNDPTTGQNPVQQVGGEFNVRVWVTNPHGVNGYLDVVGDLAGGGPVTSAIDGTRITATLDLAAIGAPDRFHWRSDTLRVFEVYGEVLNGVTESAVARVARYGVLWDPYARWQEAGPNTLDALLGTNPVIAAEEGDGGTGTVTAQAQESYHNGNTTIQAQTTTHAGARNLRNATGLKVANAAAYGHGSVNAHGVHSGLFRIDGDEGETGPLPVGLCFLDVTLDGYLAATGGNGAATAETNAALHVEDAQYAYPMGNWNIESAVTNGDRSRRWHDRIDLQAWGLEVGRDYLLTMSLDDDVIVPEAAQVTDAIVLTDSTLHLDVVIEPVGDLNGDGVVDLADLARFTSQWLTGT